MIPLERGVVVLVGKGVQEELGTCPAGRVRRIVVSHALGIEELADVVRVVACVLEPKWEVVFIETLGDELGIAAYDRPSVHVQRMPGAQQTIGRIDVRDVGVVCSFASPQADP